MKAFLLSAGNATRLRPLTDEIPKCLIPVRGIPMLAIWLESCLRAGVTDVLINLHWKPEPVREFIRQYKTPLKIHLTYEEELLGSAGTIFRNWDWVKGESRFLVLYSDVLTNFDLRHLLKFDESRDGVLSMGIHRVSNPKDCGLVELDNNRRVLKFEEKPAVPISELAFAGMLVAHQGLKKYDTGRTPLDFGRDIFPELPGWMWGYIIGDYLIDIGTLQRFEQAQLTWPGFSNYSGSD